MIWRRPACEASATARGEAALGSELGRHIRALTTRRMLVQLKNCVREAGVVVLISYERNTAAGDGIPALKRHVWSTKPYLLC